MGIIYRALLFFDESMNSVYITEYIWILKNVFMIQFISFISWYNIKIWFLDFFVSRLICITGKWGLCHLKLKRLSRCNSCVKEITFKVSGGDCITGTLRGLTNCRSVHCEVGKKKNLRSACSQSVAIWYLMARSCPVKLHEVWRRALRNGARWWQPLEQKVYGYQWIL